MPLLRERLLAIASVQRRAGARYCSGLAALLIAILVGGIAAVIAQEVSIKILVNDEPISDYDIDQRERFLAMYARANTLVRAADPDGDRPRPVRMGAVPGAPARGPSVPESLIRHRSRPHRVPELCTCPNRPHGRFAWGCSEPRSRSEPATRPA